MKRPWPLAVGMFAGAALAVFYIVRVPQSAEPETDTAAWVGDRPISRGSYESALQAVAGDRKSGTLRADDRERVLDRLIDQELLIDRAIELGLHERDPQIRNQLVTSMIDFLVRGVEDEAPDEAALRAFYDEHGYIFQRSTEYRVVVEGGGLPLPDGFLLGKEIQQRLGPSASRRVSELEVGESTLIGEGDAQATVRLLERRGGQQVPFEEAREAVEAAYLRERSEAAVRDFLEVAREHTDIRIEVVR